MMMKSTKPYLLEAMYRWMVDSNCAPLIQVRTDILGVVVPDGYARNNIIILDISDESARNLLMDEHIVTFEAVFDDVVHKVRIPMPAILAIHAEENGMGMEFHDEDESTTESDSSGSPELRVL